MSDWRDKLIMRTDRKGNQLPVSCTANAVTILVNDEHWRDVIAYDAFGGVITKIAEPPWDIDDSPNATSVGDWSDADDERASNFLMRRYNVNVPARSIRGVISVVAERKVIDPVKDWLGALTWDGHPRIEHFFSRYFGSADDAYTRQVSKIFLIGAVARALRPGCKLDTMPILESAQGIGKSSAIRALAGSDWFLETRAVVDGKDAQQILRRKWVIEYAEMDSISSREAPKAKAFISTQVDSYRPSYGRSSADFPRRCVFVGSTNAGRYLKDETGARRFLPIRCGRISVQGIRDDRDQIWAEARTLFERGEAWHVTDTAIAKLCVDEQESRYVRDPWEAAIEEWVDTPVRRRDGVTTHEVLRDVLRIETSRWNRADEMRVAAILGRLKWERGAQVVRNGARVRPYLPKVVQVVPDVVNRSDIEKLSLTPLHAQPTQPDLRTRIGNTDHSICHQGSGGGGGGGGAADEEREALEVYS